MFEGKITTFSQGSNDLITLALFNQGVLYLFCIMGSSFQTTLFPFFLNLKQNWEQIEILYFEKHV